MAVRVSPDDAEPDAVIDDEPVVGERLVLEECTIVRWRGYTKSTFIACLADGTPVAESPSFKARGDDAPPEHGPAGKAHAELLRRLEALGWSRSGDGEAWFDVRYGRWIAAPEALESELEEEEPAAAPASPLPPPLPVHILRDLPPPVAERPSAPAPPPAAPRPEPAQEPVRRVVAVGTPSDPPAHGKRGSPSWRIVLISILGVVSALALGVYIAKHNGTRTRTVYLPVAPPHASKTVARPAATTAAAPTTAAKPKPKPAAKQTAPTASTPTATQTTAATPPPVAAPAAAAKQLVLANVGHASWVEVRRDSNAGPVLYSGIADPGTTLRYTGKRFWVRFAAASNFRITVGGHPVALHGTVEFLFEPGR